MDQAALQVLHYIKEDLDLFLIDLKYIKEVVTSKLSDPVTPTEFNLTLSELSSVNAPLRRPTIACICRASAINIDAQSLRINVDNQFYDRFFSIIQALQLSNEDNSYVTKAYEACVETPVVKADEKSIAGGDDDYFEKYDDDDNYDDDDSQSKGTFENKNLNVASYVEDSMYSDNTPLVEGATASKVFTGSEYEDTKCEQTNYADTARNENNDKKKDPTASNSYYDDDDFEGNGESVERSHSSEKKVDSTVDLTNVEITKDNLKESTASDDNYDDNDFEDSGVSPLNNSTLKLTETSGLNESAATGGDDYDNDFEESANVIHVELPDKNRGIASPFVSAQHDSKAEVENENVVMKQHTSLEDNNNATSSASRDIGEKSLVSNGSYYDNDFEESVNIEGPTATEEVGMKSVKKEKSADTGDYDVDDFEDSFVRDKDHSNSGSQPTKGDDIATKEPTSIDEINTNKDTLNTSVGGDDEFEFPNLDVIEDSGDSGDSDKVDIAGLPADSSPDGKATKYGSLARRDSMLTFLSKFSSSNINLSDDEKVQSKEHDEDKQQNDDHNDSHYSDQTNGTDEILRIVSPRNLGDDKQKLLETKKDLEDSHSYGGDEDDFYEDHDDDFEDPSHFSPEKDPNAKSAAEFSPQKEVPTPIPYPESEEKKPEVSEETVALPVRRPQSANPSPSMSLGGEMQVRPVSAQGTSGLVKYDGSNSKSTTQTSTMTGIVSPSAMLNSGEDHDGDDDNDEDEDEDDIGAELPATRLTDSTQGTSTMKSNQQAVEQENMMEAYARKPRATAMFIDRAQLQGKKALVVQKFRPNSAQPALSPSISEQRVRPQSAQLVRTSSFASSSNLTSNSRYVSPPKQTPISPRSPLLVRTESLKQVYRPTSADNGWTRTSGTMTRSQSADNKKQLSKYAEKFLIAQKKAEAFVKKPPIPLGAFSGCVKPENKGHIFDDYVPPKKASIPLECFANTVKPENPGHVFESPKKPPPHPRIPYNEFEPPPEKKLPVVDESKPVKNLQSFHRLVANKALLVENSTKCVHEMCKEEAFQAMKKVYEEREVTNEKELAMISRNSRKINPNATTFAETVENQVKHFQERPQPGKRHLTQDHVDKFRKFVDDTKETSYIQGRVLMCQARLRHDKELTALEESLREPCNRMRKFFDKKLFQLSQAQLRNNTAFNHFKNMLASFKRDDEVSNKEIQQGRVHRAAVECHTILFCCLDVVKEVDREVQELKEKLEAFMENEYENFNFSATNSVHFFPEEFHEYFGNANTAPVTAAYAAPHKTKTKSRLKKKKPSTKKYDESDHDKSVNEKVDVFLTQGDEEGIVCDDAKDETERATPDKVRPDKAIGTSKLDLSAKENYNNKDVMELLSEWLAGGVDEEKTAAEWVGAAVEAVNSIDCTHVLQCEIKDVAPEVNQNREDHGEQEQDKEQQKQEQPTVDDVVTCLAEWLEEGLHKQDANMNKSGPEWLRAAKQCLASHSKKKYKKKKKKLALQPYPCSQCNRLYRGKGKSLPSRLSSGAGGKATKKFVKEVNYLRSQKPQPFKFSNGRANDKLFCSWECTQQWNNENTPILHRYATDQLIRIAAGEFK